MPRKPSITNLKKSLASKTQKLKTYRNQYKKLRAGKYKTYIKRKRMEKLLNKIVDIKLEINVLLRKIKSLSATKTKGKKTAKLKAHVCGALCADDHYCRRKVKKSIHCYQHA